MNKVVLICGVSGQDGALLAKLLLAKGYDVWGTSRDAEGSNFSNLVRLGIRDSVRLISMNPEDFSSVFRTIKQCNPNEIYFLAGQSSVGLSFEQPVETIQSNVSSVLNILETCRILERPIRLYNAASSEVFGNTGDQPANEETPFRPRSPYAVAKASAFWLVNNYREAYGLFVCNGIAFNHESPLRPERFVTQKIISAARRIAAGSREKLQLGRLDIARDWGWAPEYVNAMWLMLQQDSPDDYIIATGQTNTLETFVAKAFAFFNLDWREHVQQNQELFRPTDLLVSRANPAKAELKLGWKARFKLDEIIDGMAKEAVSTWGS
jgi:GDPmannose 4,6-dehydratase